MSVAVASSSPLVANMTALYRRDPRLADRLDLLEPDPRLLVEPARNGAATATMQLPDGRRLTLHSRHDPQADARQFVESGPPSDASCVVLCGMGLGYHVRALLDQLGPEGLIIVSEPHLPTVRAALAACDLSDAISAARVVLLTSLDKRELHDRLTPHATQLLLGTRIVVPPPARTLHADFHAACRQAIADFATFSRMSLITLVANGRRTCDNIASNLAVYLATPTVELLRGRCAGVPAVVVSAGPSLQRNIDALAGAVGRVVIIAVQTALKPLLARGIRPDFVTTLDFSDLSKRFFEGVDDLGDTLLVAEPKAAPAVIDAFRGGPAHELGRC